MEWNLWNTGKVADPKSPSGSAYGFMKPKTQAIEISNSSKVLQFASRRFLDRLLGGEDGKRTNRQLKDAEFGNKGIDNLRELMDVLPNIDVSDVMEIPKVFRCDEQTLPCDHTTKYRTLTGWCNNLLFPEYGKSIRAFTRSGHYNSIFFCFLFVKKSFICLEGKSMTPSREILFSSVPPSNSLVPVSDP